MSNYNIIGGDGRQYGPITANELRKWVAQKRLNEKSLVQPEGASEWSPLESFPEFADVFGVAESGLPPALPVNPEEYSKQVLAREPDVRLSECLKAGFSFFKENAGFVIGAVFVSWFLNSAMRFIPIIGGILHLILGGVVTGGLYFACVRRMRGERVSVGNVFDGFRLCFVQLMLAGAISQLLTQFGFMFCILPGIYLLIAWIFALPLVADKRLEFWSAMELSRKVSTRVWFPLFGLLLLIFLPFIAAQTLMGIKIGTFLYSTFRDANYDLTQWAGSLKGHLTTIMSLSVIWVLVCQVLYLLCQFVAVGALMRAYENLFGERRH